MALGSLQQSPDLVGIKGTCFDSKGRGGETKEMRRERRGRREGAQCLSLNFS